MHDDDLAGTARFALTRRRTLAGTLALAAPAILGRPARAAGGKVVIACWGGDYGRLLAENVEQPILSKQDIEVIQDVGDEPQRMAKMQAQRRLPRGTMDVVCVQAVAAYQLAEMGLVEELNTTNVPNISYVNKALSTPTYAPHIYSPQVLIYNPERVATPPTTFSDLLDPKYANKVGFPDGNFFYAMLGAALSGSGPNDLDKAKEFMTKLNAAGLKLYPTTDSAGPPFKSGELDGGIMWLARVIMWQNAGIPVKAAFPREGAILYVSGMVVPKNAPNKEAAFAYINAMLDPSAQRGFAQNMGYLPTVTNAPLTGQLGERLAMPDPAPKLVVPDYAFTTKVQPETADWWKKTIQHT